MQHNIPLAQYTTFQLGGPCQGLVTCQTPVQLKQTINDFVRKNYPFILIGGGSNIVVSDKGLDCYVIRYVSDNPIIQRLDNTLSVSGSTSLDALAAYAAEAGLEGLNYTSGIPGTVGGAIVGNAGAFGQQIGDVTSNVEMITPRGIKQLPPSADLKFSYRHSRLKKTGNIVASACFQLKQSDPKTLLKQRQEILNLRQEKHPNLSVHPCAGSFFRNIEPSSKAEKRAAAGWFLEQAGVKKFICGGAGIFEKHANIIIKTKNGTAQDVFTLSQKMTQAVKKHFNINLIREVRFAGHFDGMPDNTHTIIW